MNAKIGKEDVYQNVAGKHTLHEITNRNCEWVCDYAIANNMKIISTYYQHKRIHKGTWTSPDGNTLNQTDHVIKDANKKGVVRDVRTMRGLNCDSDHFLMKTTIKQKLVGTQMKTIKQIIWNKSNSQDPAMLKQYRKYLHNRLIGKEVQQDIEGVWTQIKEAIIESANEVIQTQTTSNRNEWWDESCKVKMSQKNGARRKYLHVKTGATREIYEAKRTEANRICREKKGIWINNKIRQIEARNKKMQEIFLKKLSFPISRNRCYQYFVKTKVVTLSEHGDILRRWRQYFCDLQTINTRPEELISENIILSNAEEVPLTHLLRSKSSYKEAQNK